VHLKLDTRLLSVDLLRALAATFVYLFHVSLFAGFDKFSLPISIQVLAVESYIPNFFSLGASGVSIFFAISGYCLTR
jgi:peptidoglycan/LPS O-acetylase OafA/YrhL